MSLVPNLVHIENGASNVNLRIGGGGQNSLVSTDSFKVEASQTLALKGYDVKAQCGGSFAIANNDQTQAYVFPNPNSQFPSANQIILFQSDGSSQFSNLPDVPVPPSGSSFMYNQSVADLNMNNHAISNCTDVSTANYSLETVGAQTDSNVSEITTLQSQVSTLEQKVADLSAVIFSLTGVSIP